MSGRHYLTTSIPYVNAPPHLGFALEAVQADVFARYHRLRGADTRLLSGTDDNGLKNVLAAERAGVPVRELVDGNARAFEALGPALDLSYDDFIRTSADARHLVGVRRLWEVLDRRGDIYKRHYEGLYCVGCEQFYTPDELVQGRCPDHGTLPETVREENYFFRLSRYQEPLQSLLASGRLRIIPEARRNEVLALVARGCRTSASPAAGSGRRGWGIEVPGDPRQVMYVWFDALANYITALGYGAPSGPLAPLLPGAPEGPTRGRRGRRGRRGWRPLPALLGGGGVEGARHRQGHPALPRRLLAGHAPLRRRAPAGHHLRPRLPHRGRAEAEQVPGERGRPPGAGRALRGGRRALLAAAGRAPRRGRGLHRRAPGGALHRRPGQRPGQPPAAHGEHGAALPPGGDPGPPGAAPGGCPRCEVAAVATAAVAALHEALARYDPQSALGALWEVVARANRYVEETAPWTLAPAAPERARRRPVGISTGCWSPWWRPCAWSGRACAPSSPVRPAPSWPSSGQAPAPRWEEGLRWGAAPGAPPTGRVQAPRPLFPRLAGDVAILRA